MEVVSENTCTSVFVHNPSELTEAFTELWAQLINEKESSASININENVVLQTNISGL